jgi:hypothetical protein
MNPNWRQIFITVRSEVSSITQKYHEIYRNLKIHNFDNIKYLCNQSTELDETGTKLLRKLYSTTLPMKDFDF